MNEITRVPLPGGIRLTCITTARFKTAVLSVSLVLPLGLPNAAPFAVLPHVLRRGTAEHPDLPALGAVLDGLYGMRVEPIVRARGEALVLGLVADVIDETYGGEGLTAKAAGLLLSFLTAPYLENGGFRAEYVHSEAENLADRIAARKNDLRSWAVRRLWELMCEGEPYGRSELGTPEQARALTPEAVAAACRDALENASMELFYCGAQPPARVEEAFRAALPSRPERPFSMPKAVVLAAPPHGERRFEESLPVRQGKLSLGFRIGITSADPLYPALLLANAVYGGSTSSRLFRNVRERLSLCYYASSQVFRLKGVMAVTSGVDNENAETAREEILRQLDDLQRHGPAPEELETARRTVLTSLRAMADSPFSLEGFWLDQAIAGLDWPPEALAAEVERVTPEAVAEAARRITPDTTFFLKGAAT